MNTTTSPNRPADLQLRAYQQAGDYLFLDTLTPGEFFVIHVEDPTRRYTTDATSCSCPDHQKRGRTCKHSLMLRLHGLVEVPEPTPAPEPATSSIEEWRRPVSRETIRRRMLEDFPSD